MADEPQVNQGAMLAYIKAFIALQSEIADPIKDANNPHFRSRYVPLQTMLSDYRGLLAKHGFALRQLIHAVGDKHYVLTVLTHAAGHSETSQVPIICDKPGPQAFGSAVTYARRYGLGALLPVAGVDEDDDAEAAEGRQAAAAPAPRPFDLVEEAVTAASTVKDQRALRQWVARVAASKFTGTDKETASATYRQLVASFQ